MEPFEISIEPVELSLEQQFALTRFSADVDKIKSLDDAQLLLVDIYRQMLMKDALYRRLMKIR